AIPTTAAQTAARSYSYASPAPGVNILIWLPSVSRGGRSRLCECAPVLAAVKQSALDRGCGPALAGRGGDGPKNGSACRGRVGGWRVREVTSPKRRCWG